MINARLYCAAHINNSNISIIVSVKAEYTLGYSTI